MFEDKRSEPLPTEVTEEDRADAVEDEYVAKYSRDRLMLLRVQEDIERYEIKKGTRVICDRAFEMCRSLRKIAIPASVTSIGRYAFAGCESLREVVIPASVTGIGEWAFSWCRSLRKAVISASVKNIGEYAFLGCSSLSSIIVPQGQARNFLELLKHSGCDLSAIREQGDNEEIMEALMEDAE